MMGHKNLVGLLPADLLPFIRKVGESPYRAEQITRWIYQHQASSFEEMKNLPIAFRENLAGEYLIGQERLLTQQRSQDGATKYLFELKDRKAVECVLIPHRKRMTVCLSSQVGCPVGCPFCATGLSGFQRNLDFSEIVEQAWRVGQETSQKINNLVFMGMGEPLLNYEQLTRALKVFQSPHGFGIGVRHITISTVGIPEKIIQLANEWPQINLALSLHAPNNDLRNRLVPLNQAFPIPLLLRAVDESIKKTGRRVTLEYALWKDINDQREYAYELISLLRGRLIHVNLIPGNPVLRSSFIPSSGQRVMTFARILEENKIPVTIRQSRGQDIEAACGELYATQKKERGGSQ
ncbi:MAG: 23S rRNA (adenine(2503)-C(2))-methyltransferase RlmN [Candidatus Atribacteria bacterium]|nr:23S rRNA (adenine(2503)-C(2))-methyltransferase RlmN [Candidatus Atribacteria bacterium]